MIHNDLSSKCTCHVPPLIYKSWSVRYSNTEYTLNQGSNFIAAIAVEREQNAVDHCGNDGNFLPYSAIFILFTVHYYFDTWIQMLIKSCVNHYFSLSFLRKNTLKKYVDMFVACQKSQVTIKLKFYYSNLKNAVETTKIAVDSCYVLRQFLTPLPSIDFREIRGLHLTVVTLSQKSITPPHHDSQWLVIKMHLSCS
jgi:hypothetical protein